MRDAEKVKGRVAMGVREIGFGDRMCPPDKVLYFIYGNKGRMDTNYNFYTYLNTIQLRDMFFY